MYGQITNGPALLKLSAQAEERSMSGIQHGLTRILVEPSLTLKNQTFKGKGSFFREKLPEKSSREHGNHKPQRKLSLNVMEEHSQTN